eukprot:6311676-Amphidinium_carterae.1
MGCTIAALDISTAFLNAPLPPERKILFFWPKCLLALGVLDSLRPAWVTAALYGIMESPKYWADFRDADLRKQNIMLKGVAYVLLQSEVSRSIWFLVRKDEKVVFRERDASGTGLFSCIARLLSQGAILAVLGTGTHH